MTSAESLNYARRYLQKAEEYLASARDNFDLERTPRRWSNLPTESFGRVADRRFHDL